MTIMCFLFQELMEEEDSPHDSNVFFVSIAVGGKDIPHDSHMFFCFKSCWRKRTVHMTVTPR